MTKCDCSSCKLHTKVKQVLINYSIPEKNQLIEELFEMGMYAESNVEYYKAIYDGTWPTAVKQLERALERAKEYEKTQSVFRS